MELRGAGWAVKGRAGCRQGGEWLAGDAIWVDEVSQKNRP